MRLHRHRVMTTVLAVLMTTGGWLAMHAIRQQRIPALRRVSDWQPQTWYRLDAHGPSAACELPAGHRYRLVVGCLSDATQKQHINFSLVASQSRSRDDDQGELNAEPLPRYGIPWTNLSTTHTSSATDRAMSDQPLVAPREFFLHVTDGDLDDPRQYARITANNVACGTRVRIFVDQQLPVGEVSKTRIDELLEVLEADVVPRVELQFGPLNDVDGDGCLAIVLTPWLSRLQGGRTSIGGLVRTSDFQRNVSPPLGNRGDMLFLNSALPDTAALRDLLSHEVAHAACISQRLSQGTGLLRDEEDWLSEALAHLAEPGRSNLEQRLTAFLDDPSQYPLVVPDYYRAGLWRNPGCRGATFLFTRWCVNQGEPQLVRQLAQSVQSGTRNLEHATGRRFEDLFRDWSLFLASGDDFATSDWNRGFIRPSAAGVRPTICHSAIGEHTLQICGTAFAVIDLPKEESSPRTLRISGDSVAKWQYSICRCPADSRERTQSSTLAAIKP